MVSSRYTDEYVFTMATFMAISARISIGLGRVGPFVRVIVERDRLTTTFRTLDTRHLYMLHGPSSPSDIKTDDRYDIRDSEHDEYHGHLLVTE